MGDCRRNFHFFKKWEILKIFRGFALEVLASFFKKFLDDRPSVTFSSLFFVNFLFFVAAVYPVSFVSFYQLFINIDNLVYYRSGLATLVLLPVFQKVASGGIFGDF